MDGSAGSRRDSFLCDELESGRVGRAHRCVKGSCDSRGDVNHDVNPKRPGGLYKPDLRAGPVVRMDTISCKSASTLMRAIHCGAEGRSGQLAGATDCHGLLAPGRHAEL